LKELSVFKEEPEVISLIQKKFVDHGLYIKNGYLMFLRVVIMNLKNCHDTRQGFVQFIVPAPTMVYIASESVIGLLRTLYQDVIGIFTSKFGRAANLQDSQIPKVAITKNRLLKLVASTLGGRFTHVKPMVPCPTPTLCITYLPLYNILFFQSGFICY
jgi:hypothetical protein